ncbi:MAG TPA: type II toxin-antitoxin system VapC family toxin [Gemmataceae bacterium]|jgi:PIN domain nuclease of toxin-antitoxin system
MTLLLDTHTFLWFCQDDPSLSAVAKAMIEDPGNRKLVSVASCWEIAIKAGLGKLILGEPSATYLPNALSRTGFDLLAISLTHVIAVESLPQHHKDPFDRLLICQAQAEGIPIVSTDSHFDAYGIARLW